MKRALSQFPSWLRIVAVAAYSLIATDLSANPRIWKDASGKFEIEAQFVSADAKHVHLKRADGSLLKIARSKLSKADLEFVADATDRGSHRVSSAERLVAGAKALEFLDKYRFPKPRHSSANPASPDDALIRASVEGLAMIASGEARQYRDRIETCREFIDRYASPRSNTPDREIGLSTRALAYCLMFTSEHALQFNNAQTRRLSHELATNLLARQAKEGGWSASGITQVINGSSDGTSIALIALAGVAKLGEVDGAKQARNRGLEFLKQCTVTEPPGSGMVTMKPGGDVHESENGVRSMFAGNAFSLNGGGVTPEFASILAMLRKLGRNMVMPGNQKSVERIEGEMFLALLFHHESNEDSANFWDHRLQAIVSTQREDGSFPDPAKVNSGASHIIAAFNQKAAKEYEDQETERHLPATIQTTAFRTLTLLIPQGNLKIFTSTEP